MRELCSCGQANPRKQFLHYGEHRVLLHPNPSPRGSTDGTSCQRTRAHSWKQTYLNRWHAAALQYRDPYSPRRNCAVFPDPVAQPVATGPEGIENEGNMCPRFPRRDGPEYRPATDGMRGPGLHQYNPSQLVGGAEWVGGESTGGSGKGRAPPWPGNRALGRAGPHRLS